MKVDTSKLSFATKYWLALAAWFVAGFVLSGMEFSGGRALFLGITGFFSALALYITGVEGAIAGEFSDKGKS